MFDYYLKNKKYGLYNTNSIKYTMLCAAAQGDSVTLSRIYDSLSANRQQSIVLTCTIAIPLSRSHLHSFLAIDQRPEARERAHFLSAEQPRVSASQHPQSQRRVQQHHRRYVSRCAPTQVSTKVATTRAVCRCSIPSIHTLKNPTIPVTWMRTTRNGNPSRTRFATAPSSAPITVSATSNPPPTPTRSVANWGYFRRFLKA